MAELSPPYNPRKILDTYKSGRYGITPMRADNMAIMSITIID